MKPSIPLFLFTLSTIAMAAPAIELIASPEPGWPQFRGPRRDGICDERGLLQTWPEGGPKELWSAGDIGRGFSAPIIAGGRIFITGDVGEELHVFALDLAGRKVWQTKNGASWREDYPGARASAAYRAGRLYHQNAHGRLACFDAQEGREIWAVDLLGRFGGKNITWGLSEGALVDDDAVYAVAGGSEALLAAFDAKTGALRWQSAPLRDTEGAQAVENASYVSPVLVRFAGQRLLLGCSLRHVFCADADTGEMQWTRRFPTAYAVLASMPAVVDDGFFMTAPHGRDGTFFRLVAPAQAGGKIGVEEGWTSSLDTCQGGVVHADGRLYGSFYGPRKGWAALDAKTGATLYTLSELVKGAGLFADGRLYALAEDGQMALLEPGAREFIVRGKFTLADAKNREAWAHPVIHDGRLYLRYHEKLRCFDVRAPK
jgi:outer membrane protein assembly factor BamB